MSEYVQSDSLQAKMLNEAGTELNVVDCALGMIVQFYKYSDAL